jgi:hypothetical protein
VTRTRWAVVAAAVAVLIALLGWQYVRQREIARCLEAGGTWDGPNSRCAPAGPILQGDIYRS